MGQGGCRGGQGSLQGGRGVAEGQAGRLQGHLRQDQRRPVNGQHQRQGPVLRQGVAAPVRQARDDAAGDPVGAADPGRAADGPGGLARARPEQADRGGQAEHQLQGLPAAGGEVEDVAEHPAVVRHD